MSERSVVVFRQIMDITALLIEAGVSVCQNFPANKDGDISFIGKDKVSVALKNVPYVDLYEELLEAKCYNMKLLDGALVQLMYRFSGEEIISHRLSFFPSPYLEDYQSALEIYESDQLYGDVVRESIMPFPIRFDFSVDENVYAEIYHARSHLTLGEFGHCRIPVSSPLLPVEFVSFIMRHFYFENRNELINEQIYGMSKEAFGDTISNAEREVSYFCV